MVARDAGLIIDYRKPSRSIVAIEIVALTGDEQLDSSRAFGHHLKQFSVSRSDCSLSLPVHLNQAALKCLLG